MYSPKAPAPCLIPHQQTLSPLGLIRINLQRVMLFYRIAVADLDAFMVGRKPEDAAPPRRKAAASFQRDFA
jgi:hypothetical protein